MAQRLRTGSDACSKKTSSSAKCLPFPTITSLGAAERQAATLLSLVALGSVDAAGGTPLPCLLAPVSLCSNLTTLKRQAISNNNYIWHKSVLFGNFTDVATAGDRRLLIGESR
jgi:hypothetical protein